MQIYFVEVEERDDEGYWQSYKTIPCINIVVANREMERIIDEADEGEFNYSEDKLVATSKSNWMKVSIYPVEVKE